MLPKVFIITLLLFGSLFFVSGFLQNKEKFLQNIKPKGNTPLSNVGAPPCPEPLTLQTPVDLSKATSVLYPGQVRGGNFKAHGGFRFDGTADNAIEVKAPMDANLTDASRYIEQGEVQYLLDFQSNCGIRYRFDHILALSAKFISIAEKLPQPKVDDSRTTHINQDIKVSAGEVIATKIGFKSTNNVTVDFGVYDMRGKVFSNPQDNAVCWFDLLSTTDSARVKSLPPGDYKSGAQSTLCK